MRGGCVIITKKMPDTYYYRDAPFVILDHWSELETTLEELLSNPEVLNRLQNRTDEWYKQVCCEEAIAGFIAAKLQHC